jgi:hypothetical protein
MRLVSGWEHREVSDFGNYRKAFTTEARRHREKRKNLLQSWVLVLEVFSVSLCLCGESVLFQNAVVDSFAFPVGGGLDEGQEYGMGVFFCGR